MLLWHRRYVEMHRYWESSTACSAAWLLKLITTMEQSSSLVAQYQSWRSVDSVGIPSPITIKDYCSSAYKSQNVERFPVYFNCNSCLLTNRVSSAAISLDFCWAGCQGIMWVLEWLASPILEHTLLHWVHGWPRPWEAWRVFLATFLDSLRACRGVFQEVDSLVYCRIPCIPV